MSEKQETVATWEFGDNLAVESRPTGELKWFPRSMMQAHDLVLYQKWEIKTFSGGKPYSRNTEWRKVETGDLDELRNAH